MKRDLDENATAQGSTRPSATRLSQVLDSLPDPLFLVAPVLDASGRLVDLEYALVNGAAARQVGISEKDHLGRRVLEMYPSVEDLGLLDTYRDVLASGEPSTIRVVGFDDNGTRGDFDQVIFRSGADLAVVSHDVTEQHAAETGRAEAERRYRRLAENSEAIGLDVSAEGSITDLLGSPQRWLGWSAEQMIGKTLVELLDPDDCAELQRIMQGAGSLSGEFLVRCADGRQRWVAHESHAVTDESGTATGVISTWRDAQGEVAHRRELRDSAQQARDLADLHEIARSRAVEAVEAKTVFLSEMSEELRTPLNIILGFAQLLEMDDLTADQRASLRHITQAAQAQLTLINDILDVSRLERGTISLSVEPVGVSEILAQVADQMKVPAGHGDVSLAIPQDIDPTLQVQVDRQRALQILVRIVGNAIRFSGAGGQVTVACHDHGATVAIAVSDTGPGIDPAAAAELFSPFTRKDPNRGVSHSAGIGLAVARGLALAMDGSIEVQSTPGQGATFTLELPKGQLDHRTGVDGSDDPGTAGHLTVVYIEDNPANALLLTKITQLRANVTCLVAPTGLEGLALVASERPDLVFLDLHLPDIDGAECLRRLRADPATQDLPVVIVTADAATSLHRQLIDLGATCTMTKPVSIADVLTWLDNPTGPNP